MSLRTLGKALALVTGVALLAIAFALLRDLLGSDHGGSHGH